MKQTTRLFMTIGIILLAGHLALGVDVKVIANTSVKTDTITISELRGVYLLQRKTLKDGSVALPVLEQSGEVHRKFLKEFLDRDEQEIKAYYLGIAFSGKGLIPKECSSDKEVVLYVAQTKGAIGYVSSETVSDGVQRLIVISDDRQEQRKLLRRVEPEYPDTLKTLNIGGTVRLEITVLPTGIVENVTLVGGNPILAEAAIKAVRQWVYSHGPTRSRLQVVIPFGSSS
jgi:TonB family protein